jgi:polyferredoxin
MPNTLVNITANQRKLKRWYSSPKVWRHSVMAFFFLFLLHVAYDHQLKGGGPRGTPSVEAYCPFGGVENLYQLLTTGGFVRHIEPSAMILLGALGVLTLLFSRGFCGWICPFGSVQEWLGLIGKKLFGKRYNPAGAWDRRLRYLKYVLLVVIIAMTWRLGTPVFRDYDPFLAFFHLGKGRSELPWAYAILGVVLVGSLWIERFFCKYACPLGAVLGILAKIGLTKVQRDAADCKECNLCQKKCHAHVDFLSVTTMRDAECNQCLDCVVDCPRPNVLTLRGPKWRFSHPIYATALVAGLLLLVGAGNLVGKWQTKPAAVAFTDQAGKPSAANIRGWMTLQEIAAGYGISLDHLYREAGIPASVSPMARMNTVAGTYKVEFSPERVRDVVDAFISRKPVPVPRENPEHASGSEADVRGFMTLNAIAFKTGVPKEYILDALGLRAEVDGRLPVREWMHAQGKSIQDIRDAVQRYREGKR